MADVLITAESQAQINADGTRSCIHLPNVEAEAEHIRAAFGNRADKHSRISVGRLNELLKDKRIWFCPAHGDAMLQGEPVLAFESDGRLEAVSIDTLVNTVRQHTGLRLIVLTGCCTALLGRRLLDGTSVADVVCWDTRVHDDAAKLFGQKFADVLSRQPTNDIDAAAAFESARTGVMTEREDGELDTGHEARVQKYELADPDDADRVCQRGEENAGRLRTKPGSKVKGRIAAGIPRHLHDRPSTISSLHAESSVASDGVQGSSQGSSSTAPALRRSPSPREVITLCLEGDVDSFDDSREHGLKCVLAGLLGPEICSGPSRIRIEKPALSSKMKAKIGTKRCCIRVEVDESQLPQHITASYSSDAAESSDCQSDTSVEDDVENKVKELTTISVWPSGVGVEDINVVFRRFSSVLLVLLVHPVVAHVLFQLAKQRNETLRQESVRCCKLGGCVAQIDDRVDIEDCIRKTCDAEREAISKGLTQEIDEIEAAALHPMPEPNQELEGEATSVRSPTATADALPSPTKPPPLPTLIEAKEAKEAAYFAMQIFVKTLTVRGARWVRCVRSTAVHAPSLRASTEQSLCPCVRRARRSPLRWSLRTPSTTSRPRSRTRRASPRISSASSLRASSWRTAAPFRTTTSRRSRRFTSCCASAVVGTSPIRGRRRTRRCAGSGRKSAPGASSASAGSRRPAPLDSSTSPPPQHGGRAPKSSTGPSRARVAEPPSRSAPPSSPPFLPSSPLPPLRPRSRRRFSNRPRCRLLTTAFASRSQEDAPALQVKRRPSARVAIRGDHTVSACVIVPTGVGRTLASAMIRHPVSCVGV